MLKGRKATTHWGLTSYFTKRFPGVLLEQHQAVTDEGIIFCSGEANARADLSRHLICKYCGNQIADHCARALVRDPARTTQVAYRIFHFDKSHSDDKVA